MAAAAAQEPRRGVPAVPGLPGRRLRAVAVARVRQAVAGLTIAGKQEREDRPTTSRPRPTSPSSPVSSRAAKEIGAARLPLAHQEAGASAHPARHFRIDGRGLTDIRSLSAEVEVIPRRTVRPVRARRDPDHGRHHP